MEDIDKLQEQIEHIDALVFALLPFFSGNKHYLLLNVHRTLEPLKHLKEMMQTMEMIRSIQEVMGNSENGTMDLSSLQAFLSPEQIQMFEMFQTMQDINM